MSVVFAPEAAGRRPGLGTNAITVTPVLGAGRHKSFRDARLKRFERRVVSSRWLIDETIAEHGRDRFAELAPRPATCGWSAGSHVGVHKRESGPARFSGIQTCGSVWSCACCGSLIRSRRALEVQAASAWWERQGGQFLFVTFTVRHHLEDSLEQTMDALTKGFTATINGAPWKRFARVHGIEHFIKAQEITLGWENGWHAHLHVLFFVDLPKAAADARADADEAWREAALLRNRDGSMSARRVGKAERRAALAVDAEHAARQGISREREREIHGWLSERWRAMVVAAGGREPSKRRGIDIRTVRHGKVVALYVSKLQEGDRPKGGWAIESEMTRQDMKKGRLDSLVPLELLDLDGLTEDEQARNRDWWVEYVATTSGRRSMTWSRGLKEAAGIDEVEDEEIAAEDAAATEDDLVIVIDKAQWRTIRDHPDQIALVLELVESDRLDELRRHVRFEYPPPRDRHPFAA